MPSEPGHGALRDKTVDELWAEYHYWKDKVANAKDWGASLAAAIEFQCAAARELNRRGEL